jgi:cyclophilin family peptidyl-prolyl cis-trans isomerase
LIVFRRRGRRIDGRSPHRPERFGLIVGMAMLLAACTASGPTATTRTNVGAKPSGCPGRPPAAMAAGETRTVTMTTRKGEIVIKVRADLAPLAAANFVALAECGYYDGVIFHRLVPGFVIQGGDRTGTGTGGPGYTIRDDPVTTAYVRGTLAMARTSAPTTQGSQFFIVLNDANNLGRTNTYAIFGSVSSGMEAVDAIAAMPNSGSPSNTALDPVAMDRVTVSKP